MVTNGRGFGAMAGLWDDRLAIPATRPDPPHWNAPPLHPRGADAPATLRRLPPPRRPPPSRRRRADPLHPPVPRPPVALRRGRGRRPDRRRGRGRADHGRLDPGLVPRPRVCPARRGPRRPGRPTGKPLAVEKVRKNRWKVDTGGAARVVGLLSGLLPRDGRADELGRRLLRPAQRRGDVPDPRRPRPQAARGHARPARRAGSGPSPACPPRPGARRTTTSPPTSTPWSTRRSTPGNPAVYEFAVDGKPHFLVNEGEGGVWDGPRSARDVEAIVQAQRAFWGSLPYDKYVFFNLLTESGGGLEHKNSTVLMSSRWATRTPGRLPRLARPGQPRISSTPGTSSGSGPVELGPFDYENEVITKSLWIAEGVTSYYGDLLVRRAGLCTVDEYLRGRRPAAGGDGDKPKGRHRAAPGHARPAGPAAGVGLVRRLDQVLPPRREHAQHGRQLLHQGGGRRLPARRRDPPGDQGGRRASTT